MVRRWAWARVGGLKEESRVKRVRERFVGEGEEGIEWSMVNVEGLEVKVERRLR